MYLSQRLASDSEDRADERQMPERRRVTSHKAQAEPDRVRANINTGKNAEILKKCETLRQYSRFVEIVRSYGHIDQLTSAAMVQIKITSWLLLYARILFTSLRFVFAKKLKKIQNPPYLYP